MTANGNFFDGLKVELALSNKPDKKEATLEAVYEGKEFNLKAVLLSDTKITIDLTSDIPKLEKISFKVERSRSGFDSSFKWGNQAKQEITLSYKNVQRNIEVNVKALGEHHLDLKFNVMVGNFNLDSRIAGHEMKIDVSVRDKKVDLEMTDPFSNSGKLTFHGTLKRSSDGIYNLDARADFDNVAYKLDMEFSSSFCLLVVSKGDLEWTLEANFSPTSMSFEMSNSDDSNKMELKGSYALDDKHFEAELSLSAPKLRTLGSASTKVRCDFDIPTKMGLTLEAKYKNEDMIRVEVEFELTSTARFNARLYSPPLGLTTPDLGVEIVYRAVSYQDFELSTEIVLSPSKRISGGLKFKLVSNELEIEVTMADYKLELNGKRLGDKIQGNLNDLNFKSSNTLNELELEGLVPFTQYPIHFSYELETLNNFKLDSKLKAGQEVDFVLKAEYEKDPMDFEFVAQVAVPSRNFDYKLELNGEYRDDEIRGNLNDLRFNIRFNDHEYELKLNGMVPLVQYPLQLEVKACIYGNFNFHLKADNDLELGLLIQGATNGDEGKFELTYSGEKRHSMRLQMDQNRLRRAIFESDSLGTYAFESDQEALTGVLALTTPHGTHKLTYDMDNEDFTLNLKLDSPWIQNGHATAFVTFNTDKNLYGIRLALSDQHFMRYSYKKRPFIQSLHSQFFF